MAVKIFAACFLLLHILGACSSVQNTANKGTDKLKNEDSSVFHQGEPKNGTKDFMFEELFGIILSDNKRNNEATTEKEKTENTAAQKATTVEEMKSNHTSDKTTQMLSTNSQSPSTSEVRQHSLEAKTETSGSSVTFVLDKTTPSVNGKTREIHPTSQSDSSHSELVLSTTNSSVSSTNETYSSVTQTASSESLMGGVTTESNVSVSEIVTKVVSEAPEHVNKNSSKGKMNLVTALLCVLTGLTAIGALLVYKKFTERRRNVQLEYLKLLP